MKRLQHISVAKCAIYFGRKGLPTSEMLKCVDDMIVQDVLRAPHGFTNLASNVPRVPVDEVVYGNELTGNGRRLMLRP